MTIDEKKKRRYSKLEKERLVSRLLPPENISVTELSKETGISKSTLQTWKTNALETKDPGKNKGKKVITPKDKFLIVMETYLLSEIELSKYCRENGLFVEEVKNWHAACINSASSEAENINVKEFKIKQQEDAKKIRALEKELYIKDKALAETTALLVLRKKLHAILVENEED